MTLGIIDFDAKYYFELEYDLPKIKKKIINFVVID